MTTGAHRPIIRKMKRFAYITLIVLLALSPLIAQETEDEDSLQKSQKREEVLFESSGDGGDSEGSNLGGIIEGLFRSAVEAYENGRDDDEEDSSERYYLKESSEVESDESSAHPVSSQKSYAPAPSSESESKVIRSKSRDVFRDENNNGIDDSREKSSYGGKSKRRSN